MPKAKNTQRNTFLARHAFTLIEILVVVAILAALVAVVLPVIWRARESARGYLLLEQSKAARRGVPYVPARL
ncbi:MAG: hypothetical protein KatS3mg022_0988 [Armatimonadota bacterium]|nr:MAG: hypothetical protein KatS3mg022_0988 [Armatimonadota bacterium]